MKMVEIPLYRISPAPQTGIGWVHVSKWNGSFYEYMSTFRSESGAQDFINRELDDLQDEEDFLTTQVCDSCGKRVASGSLVSIMDEGMESWEICEECNKRRED